MNGILGYAVLLELDGGLNSAQAQKAERIKAGCRHFATMTEQILNFARLDGGHEVVHAESLDAREIAREAGVLVESAANAKGLTFVLDVPDAPVPLITDGGKVRQILVNLCGNAVKYSGEGEVRLRVRAEADRVIVDVRDSGMGIAPQYHARIFERFWQVDGGLTRAGPGMGIGLAASKEYARLLGGDVEVDRHVGWRQHVLPLVAGVQREHQEVAFVLALNAATKVVPTPARADVRRQDDTLVMTLTGAWKLEEETPRFEQLAAASIGEVPGRRKVGAIGFDTTGLHSWDSSLLIFLLHGVDYCAARGLEFETTGLSERLRRLLALARAVPERVVERAEPKVSRVAKLGERGLSAWEAGLAAVTFTGEVTDSFIRLALRRAHLRWRDFWVVVQSNSSGALPIVTLIALLVGVIIAFLGVVLLRRFGAGYYVSYLIGYGMLREMGALMTGIIIAGRTGAGFAAELGSMKITEEIDAYSTLGVSPIDHLVLPRILGLFVMMPLLVIYADFVGVAGGMIVAITMLDLTPTQFVGGLLTAVTLSDGLLGIFKGTLFGLIIGLSGCLKGMQTGSDAGAVGRSATSAVVMGITLIIVGNTVVDWLAALLQI